MGINSEISTDRNSILIKNSLKDTEYDLEDIVSDSITIPSPIKKKILKIIDKDMKRQKNNEKIRVNRRNDFTENRHENENDILSRTIQKCKTIVKSTYRNWEDLQQSKIFKILFGTTQPAHVIAIIAILSVIFTMVPRSDGKINNANPTNSKLLSFIYLTSFSLHMGSQFWMTFVSGLSLYFTLPRRDFGEVQRVLFPRYFSINAGFSATTLVIFLKNHPVLTWSTETTIQVAVLTLAFLIEVLIRLYLAPAIVGLLSVKGAIEKAAGVGNEIGHYSLGPLENCPHYLKIHRSFRKFHMICAIGNILTIVCSIIHLNYIASKINF